MKGHLTTAVVYTCRSFYKPLQNSDKCTLYKSGDKALVELGDQEITVEIRHIFLLTIHANTVHVVEVDTFRKVAEQPIVSAALVESCQSSVFVIPSSIKRKVMIIPATERLPGSPKYLVIDHLRPFPVSDHRQVVVPYFPSVNDMVLVQGADLVPWQGCVVAYEAGQDLFLLYFTSRIAMKGVCG